MNLGKRLLRHLAREVVGQGGVYVELQVDLGNVPAQRFYQRIGMERDDDYVYNFMDDALLAFAGSKDDEENA
jgi:ribosomal protein S18 acetylase RimI-like enzyme